MFTTFSNFQVNERGFLLKFTSNVLLFMENVMVKTAKPFIFSLLLSNLNTSEMWINEYFISFRKLTIGIRLGYKENGYVERDLRQNQS